MSDLADRLEQLERVYKSRFKSEPEAGSAFGDAAARLRKLEAVREANQIMPLIVGPTRVVYDRQDYNKIKKALAACGDEMSDPMKELREAHNRIRYLEDRLELVSNDGRRLSEDCDGISCRNDTIKLQDERIERLKADLSVARQSLYEVVEQRNALLASEND